jgi:hypothetical protein
MLISALNGQLTLQWDAVSGVDTYRIYLGETVQIDISDPLSYTLTADTASTAYTFSGLINGHAYYAVVTAWENGQEGAPGQEVFATPMAHLNDTGMSLCGDYAWWYSGNHQNLLDCQQVASSAIAEGEDAEGDPVPAGQDGWFGRDALDQAGTLEKTGQGEVGFDFTKLDEDGNALIATATSYACVRDNRTGLVWENKQNDGGVHDLNHTYSWYNSDSATNGGTAGAQNGGTCPGAGCDTEAFINMVNIEQLCGVSDWRLPTVTELFSLAHLGRSTPAADWLFFSDTLSSEYWTATSNASNNGTIAWSVDFRYGMMGTDGTNNDKIQGAYPVRLVSGGGRSAGQSVTCQTENSAIPASTPSEAFLDHLDGTVTDTTTGLMWKVCSESQTWNGSGCDGGVANYTWLEASRRVSAVNTATFAGYGDWRMPDLKELASIVEHRCSTPSINQAIFKGVVAEWYWSSSPHYSLTSAAWAIDFSQGGNYPNGKSSSLALRLVRGGEQ